MDNKLKNTLKIIAKNPFFERNPCFYYYCLKGLIRKISLLEKYLPKNFEVYYAMKANPHNQILSLISKKKSLGIEIASEGELLKAIKYFKSDRIIYTGPGKTNFELELAIKKRIKLINVESIIEAKRVNKIANKLNRKIDVLVRVNLNLSIHSASSLMGGVPSKLGVDEDKILDFINQCKKLSNLTVVGIHAYLGTGIMDYSDCIRHAKYVFTLVNKIEKMFNTNFKIIDLGGGFGVDYSGKNKEFNLNRYALEMRGLIKEFNFNDKRLLLELGRYMIADSGYYCTKIIDIKQSRDKNFVVVSGGINHLNRPCVTGENQPVEIISLGKEDFSISVNKKNVDIVGPLCLNDDILGRNVFIKFAKIGDMLIVTKSGAYSLSGSPVNLLSHRKPLEFFDI